MPNLTVIFSSAAISQSRLREALDMADLGPKKAFVLSSRNNYSLDFSQMYPLT